MRILVNADAGSVVAKALSDRLGREFSSHHALATLNEDDLGSLCCEVQFLAARDAAISTGVVGTLANVGNLNHFYLAPIEGERDSDSVTIESEAEEASGNLRAYAHHS